MSSFTSPLVVSPMPDGKYWRLAWEFTYHVGNEESDEIIRVSEGFLTDFASIPQWLWFLPRWARYSKSPVLHDWLYHCKEIVGNPCSRERADDIFLEAMLVDWRDHKSRHFVARLEWLAVRLFGFLAWGREA